MVFLFAIFIAGASLAGYFWWMLFFKYVWPRSKFKSNNPYIKFHLLKDKNDKDYEDYIEWLDKNGGGLPIPKAMSKEDAKFQDKINRLIK